MDNTSQEWERGFNAGIENVQKLLATLKVEKPPQDIVVKLQAKIERLELGLLIQSQTIQRLVVERNNLAEQVSINRRNENATGK